MRLRTMLKKVPLWRDASAIGRPLRGGGGGGEEEEEEEEPQYLYRRR